MTNTTRRAFFFELNIMNTELVTVENGVASTTSLAIAEQLDRAHKDVLKSLDKLAARRGFAPSSYIDDSGKANRMYVLNERQALIAMPFIGGLKSEEGQVALVDAFLALRKHVQAVTPLEQRIERLEAVVLSSNHTKTELLLPINYDDIKQRVLNIIYKSGGCGVAESRISINCSSFRRLSLSEKRDVLNSLQQSKDIKAIDNIALKGGKGRAGRRFFII